MPDLKLFNMASVQAEQVRWLWHPYIPIGKISIIQGDPGEGKTTFTLAMVAALTTGTPLSETPRELPPINVIYQTAEDGLADTIKPRLLSLGADCSRVMVIDETDHELTMRDKRLEQAIKKADAKLLILDPIQAYLGGSVDMYRANEVRPVINAEEFTGLIDKYVGLKELNAQILNELIEQIVVHDRLTVDGEVHQQVDIYYKFIGMANIYI